MTDLSQVRGRTDAQERVLSRSDSVLPSRRVQDAPSIVVQSNLRNAERGNPAQQLRETLGMVDDAEHSYVALDQKQTAITETKNAEIAAGDSANGSVNSDLMAKSAAYRQVIAGGRASAALATAEAEARVNVQTALNQGANADPTKGDKVFGLEDANQIVEQTFRKHTLDEQGHPIDFGDASANVQLYRGLAQVREHVLGIAAEAIRSQEQQKATDALSNSVQADLIKGDTTTLERNFQQAQKLGLDPKEVKSSFLAATLDAAMTSKSVDPITRAMNSTRPDGTPTWSAQEQATLLEAQHRMGTQFEAEHQQEAERVAHTTLGEWALGIASGKLRVTPDMVAKANSTGALDPRYNDQAFQLQSQFDNEAHQKAAWQRQQVTWGREDQSYARTTQMQAMELRSMNAKEQANKLIGSALAGGMNGQQLAGALIQNRAKLDSDTFTQAMIFARSIPDDQSFVKQAHAEDHLYELNDFLTKVGSTRQTLERQGDRKVLSENDFSKRRDNALFTFFQQLRLGAKPNEALTAAMTSTNAPRAAIDQYVNRASARHTVNNPLNRAELAKGQ